MAKRREETSTAAGSEDRARGAAVYLTPPVRAESLGRSLPLTGGRGTQGSPAPAFFQWQGYDVYSTESVIPGVGDVQGEPPAPPSPPCSVGPSKCVPTRRASRSPCRRARRLFGFTVFRGFSRNAKRGASRPQGQRSIPRARAPLCARLPDARGRWRVNRPTRPRQVGVGAPGSSWVRRGHRMEPRVSTLVTGPGREGSRRVPDG